MQNIKALIVSIYPFEFQALPYIGCLKDKQQVQIDFSAVNAASK